MTSTPRPATGGGLTADRVVVGYGAQPVLDHLSVEIPAHELTVVIGPNGCGKSTLLRAVGNLLPLRAGEVRVGERPVSSFGAKAFAREVGFLPQGPVAPEGVTVRGLVGRGRYPHRSLLGSWSEDDERAVAEALERTALEDVADRRVEALSGGQRQRVWIAMVLAQQTRIVLLDEPTTYLDLAHQIEVLDLCRELHAQGRTLVAVLHDLNLACRYATHVVAMREGEVVATGPSREVVHEELVEDVFGVRSLVLPDPLTGDPMVVPRP